MSTKKRPSTMHGGAKPSRDGCGTNHLMCYLSPLMLSVLRTTKTKASRNTVFCVSCLKEALIRASLGSTPRPMVVDNMQGQSIQVLIYID